MRPRCKRAGWTKDVVQVSHDHFTLRCFYHYYLQCLCLAIIWTLSFMQRPFIHPCAYSILILLSTAIIATAIFISLLLLLHYYHCYKTVTTDKLLRASLFPGAGELTTHLLKLINILWLPLCRINKFGFYFPRRLLRSPILVGHQRLNDINSL